MRLNVWGFNMWATTHGDLHVTIKKGRLWCVMIPLTFIITLGVIVVLSFNNDDQFQIYFPTSILSETVHVNTQVADELARKVKVLCFVTTMRGNEKRAMAVNATWLKRCTRHIFITSQAMSNFSGNDVMVLSEVPEGRNHLTAKTFAAFSYLYRHEVDNYDWFMKADDDVYIVMENLYLLLSKYHPDDPVYLGHHFNTYRSRESNGYMSGGASYILSRQALKTLGKKGLPNFGGICRPEEPDEDMEIGRCLYEVGVQPHRTVDMYTRETFHPWPLFDSIFSTRIDSYSHHPKRAGPNCFSQLTISFHYIQPRTMYTLELLLYHIDVYGRHPDDSTLRKRLFKAEAEYVTEKRKKGWLSWWH